MTCRTILSQMQNGTERKVTKRGRPILYSYKLFVPLVVIAIFTVSASCTLVPTGVPPASPEQPEIPTAPAQQPETSEPNPESTTEPVVINEQVAYITIEELSQKIESQADILVIDARDKKYYDADHIKGAISIPYSTIVAREFVLPSTNEIILYCGCPAEETSTMAALELTKQGFSGVKVLKGGYAVWKVKGYPTEPGG